MMTILRTVRNVALRLINTRRIYTALEGMPQDCTIPIFVIASPRDMHLAPAFVRQVPRPFVCLLLANGLTQTDIKWLKSRIADIPLVPLIASLSGNSRTYLSHGSVIRAAADACRRDFVIQDADCVVLNSGVWTAILNTPSDAYAAGPFWKPCNYPQFSLPDTFLVRISWDPYSRSMSKWKITPEIAVKCPANIGAALTKRGIAASQYPDTDKQYFDTLQLLWLAMELDGAAFHEVNATSEDVFHVGGSSYLMEHQSTARTEQSEWTAGTIWFHLRYLELTNDPFLLQRYKHLPRIWGDSNSFASRFPKFQSSSRYRTMCNILHTVLEK